jgi:PAS domain S-box-containing protein
MDPVSGGPLPARRQLPGDDRETRAAREAGRWFRIYSEYANLLQDRLSDSGNGDAGGHRELRRTLAWYEAGVLFWRTSLQRLNDVELDDTTRTLRYRGQELVFSRREYQLLAYLVRNPDRSFTIARLLADAWHRSGLSPEQVRLYVAQIRRKLASTSAPVEIQTTRGGYRARLHPLARETAARLDDLERSSLPQSIAAPAPARITDIAVIAESIPHIVWLAAPDGSTRYFNTRGTNYTGRPREANYDRDWVKLVHPDDARRVRAAWTHATRTETEYQLQYRIRRGDGAYRWHAFRALPLRDVHGQVMQWLGTAIDVDDQWAQETEPGVAEQRALAVLTLDQQPQEPITVGLAMLDRSFKILRINAALAAMVGSSVDERIGRHSASTVPAAWQVIRPHLRRVLATGQPIYNQEWAGAIPGMTTKSHWLSSYYPLGPADDVTGIGVMVFDITARRRIDDLRSQVLTNLVDGFCALTTSGKP